MGDTNEDIDSTNKEKKLEDMRLGELVVALLDARSKVAYKASELHNDEMGYGWENSPYPEDRPRSIARDKIELEEATGKFDALCAELDRREESYLGNRKMEEKIDLKYLVDRANFADSCDSMVIYTAIPLAIEGLPRDYYWLWSAPEKGGVSGEAKVAVFDSCESTESLKVYHFSEEEMNRAIESKVRIKLSEKIPAYVGDSAVEYLTSRVKELRIQKARRKQN